MAFFASPQAANEAQVIGGAVALWGLINGTFRWLAARKLAFEKKAADKLRTAEKKGADALLAKQTLDAATLAAKTVVDTQNTNISTLSAQGRRLEAIAKSHTKAIGALRQDAKLNAADNKILISRTDQIGKKLEITWDNGSVTKPKAVAKPKKATA